MNSRVQNAIDAVKRPIKKAIVDSSVP